MVRTLAAITLSLLAVYGVIKAVPILIGPRIVLDSPAPYQSVTDGFMTISGTAIHTQEMTLNGAPFLFDEKGKFATTLVLPKGGAILTLSATDRFGRRVSVERSVFVP